MTKRTRFIVFILIAIVALIFSLILSRGVSNEKSSVPLEMPNRNPIDNIIANSPAPKVTALVGTDKEQKTAGKLCRDDEMIMGVCNLEIRVGAKPLGSDAFGSTIVHLVEYRGDQRLGEVNRLYYELLVVKPDHNSVKKYTLYETGKEESPRYSGIKMINEKDVIIMSQIVEQDRLVYEIAKLDINSGKLTSSVPYREVLKDSEEYDDDSILSQFFDEDEYGKVSKMMLTTLKGKMWLIDLHTLEVMSPRHKLYPSYGDPGSAPSRNLIFPDPKLERFVYSVLIGDNRITNDYLIANAKNGNVITRFSIDESLQASPEVAWNKGGSLFALEYAKKGDELGSRTDNAIIVFAHSISVYNRDGKIVATIDAPSEERISIVNWLDEERLLIESYKTNYKGMGEGEKKDITYKTFHVQTGELSTYQRVKDGSLLDNAELIFGYAELGYGFSTQVYIERSGNQIWVPDMGGDLKRIGDEVYVSRRNGDWQNIFRLDDDLRSLKWVGGWEGNEWRKIIPGWLVSSDLTYKKIDLTTPLNGEGLPVLGSDFDIVDNNTSIMKENERTEHITLDGGDVRAVGKSRYGVLKMRSMPEEKYWDRWSESHYFGNYQIEFTDAAGGRSILPELKEVAFMEGMEQGEIKVYPFEGFDLLLLHTDQYKFNDRNLNVYAYVITEDGQAFPLDYRYVIPSGEVKRNAIPFGRLPVEVENGKLVYQSWQGYVWTPDLEAKTLKLTEVRHRSEEYESIWQVVVRYKYRLEQALGLTESDFPEGKLEEEELRSLFADDAWNNPGFQWFKDEIARIDEAGDPTRAFASPNIIGHYDRFGNIIVNFEFILAYSIGWLAHLEAVLQFKDGRWIFRDFGTFETEKVKQKYYKSSLDAGYYIKHIEDELVH
ncbi:hypothetical protein I6N90_24105 [Paenibacillus sp. GSMTC-2017]|uniref:hypothetical protein n=1 Tax=Paenibacillus sp. GSMTC-2017 TaxID=2794350 RepID=UPI0018D825D9|nr:hypothetical protein [Paenibacillus sp. GSMTC-2017]MBH5320877.1 hypothetical protein [Paenibacillus sp. GSMTC-2017]